MVMEALRRRTGRTESGAGQSTKNDGSVRTVARSGKCHDVGGREERRWDGERRRDGERRWTVSFSAHHTMNSGVKPFKVSYLVTCLNTFEKS